MLERLPLFINAMMRRGRYASISPAGVHDACEAVTAIVSSGKEDAEAIAAEGGALVACSIAIRDAAAETRGDGDGDGDGNGGNPSRDLGDVSSGISADVADELYDDLFGEGGDDDDAFDLFDDDDAEVATATATERRKRGPGYGSRRVRAAPSEGAEEGVDADADVDDADADADADARPPLSADEVRPTHWSPYDRVGVVNADP